MNPNKGRIYSSVTKRYSNVNEKNVNNFVYTGQTQKLGSLRCAVFKREGEETVYLQPWNETNLRKPGEQNIGAKLTTKDVRAIVRACYTKTDKEVTFTELAQKYGVRPDTIAKIAHGKAWRHVTLGYIEQLKSGNREVVESCISASRDRSTKHNKLSPSIAKFIVRDHMINKININQLATKYCVSESTVRRVVTGKMYSETTGPAIEEFSKWQQKK